MKLLGNIEQIADEFIWEDQAGLITKALGKAAGSEKLYANLDLIPQDTYSTKYHSHTQQEEFFLVLSGRGTLHLNNRKMEVRKGDYLAKPAGHNICHTFYNPNPEPLVILDVGTVEAEDTCYYPRENVYMQKSNGITRAFSGKQTLDRWSSDPNE